MSRRPTVLLGLAATAALVLAATSPAHGKSSAQPRIVNGSEASISQYPWQAALVDSPAAAPGMNAHQRQFCGGSLVTSRIVITAAHCVYGMSPGSVDVVLGRTQLSNASEGTEIPVQALSYRSNYNHPPEFSSTPPRFDVGYVVLAQPSAQTRIQIAGPSEAGLWTPGATEDISGWGCTSEPNFLLGCSTSDKLLRASVPVIADSTCGSGSVYGGDFDSATMVCAGYLSGGTDTCNGDSGGPLQAPVAGGYRLVGLTSWGDGCAEANAPGVYARVAGTTLRPLVAADVCGLESSNALPRETVVAGGAGSDAPCASATGRTAAKKALAKCKRIRDKKKRRRCVKKAKKRQKGRSNR
jgi:secreted trypsin-like serine protease